MLFTDFDLDERMLRPIRHLGFDTVTPVQERAIPEAMSGRDLLVSSKTGSGKTLAYLIPALYRVYKVKALSSRDARVLILLPTRELAKQVFSLLRLFTAGSSLKSTLILGGENFNDQHKALQKNPHFIVGTPGRLVDHLTQRNFFLDGLELLILDEADRMLDLGFADQLKQIDEAASHRLRQTLFFSATLDNASVHEMAQLLLNEPTRVAIGSSTEEHADIKQHFYLSDHLDHKDQQLVYLLNQQNIKQAIIFTATRQDTVRLAEKLTSLGIETKALNGDLSQSARNQVMDGFGRGHFKVLASTDLAARGLDIANVSHVINFDIPKHAEEYIHRTGRTGRAGFKGDAFSLVGPKDWYNFKALESFLGRTVEFDVMEGLAGKFKGLAPKKVRKQAGPVKEFKKAVKTQSKKRVAPKKKVFHSNQQDGFDAFKPPKKRSNSIPLDDKE